MNNYRLINAFLLLMAVVAISFAFFYLQRHVGLFPCPLCIFQRIGIMVMGLFAFIALIINPSKFWARLMLWFGSVLGAMWTAGVAARHIWIQNLPPSQTPACGPGLDYWVDTMPMFDVVKEVFSGSGECASIEWTLLGMSIPMQTFLLSVFLILVHLVLLGKIIRDRG
ncbi:MAG: disulfide bond formation protein B [Gammaproteobacteria bacterium]|nr:MAG: disulfide bond formation protein B [Gammaproteobacteria bacterium]